EHIEASNVNQYVIGGEVIQYGVVLVVFSGKDLHVRGDYVMGWKPLGRKLTVTKTEGDNCVARIDDMPATEIYHRYLNILPDDKFLFNICEFPLMVERNGTMLARVPPCYDDEKRLYFNGDIREGENVHLSYGHPREILRETWQASEEMHFFAPEGIWLCACGNRTFFLKEYAETEINDYARFCPNLVVSNGQAEIYVHEGKGGLLNTALVAVGMREGKAVNPPEAVDICSCPYDQSSQLIPLSTRLATFLDVTAQDLREMAIKAENANVAKSQFLSNMSHEIRTPINAILGMDEMILRECKDKAILEYAENIRMAGNNLLGLVNDILDFSKIEAGKMDIIPVEYALSSMLNDLVNMSQNRAEKKGLRFIMQVPNDIPGLLFGDEIRIKQAITNILTNAVKYTEKGSVLLSIEYEKLDEESILLKVSVQDTGIGIRKADIQKLFNAFERIEEERNRAIEGTGLGMNITQSLLKLMGSHLEISSVYGEGSTFSFAVVQKVVNWDPMGNFEDAYHQMLKKRTEYKESFMAPSARILVVDDTPMNITVVKGLLKQTRVQIDTAESGYECLNMARKKHYDIIFLDHRMPGIDGIETLERMRSLPGSLNQDTPVISLTANAVSGARSMYIEAGFQDYLTKPIHSAQLESLMMKYLPPEKLLSGGKASAPQKQE
ncbi:MAG: response regulator, partial [Selenomonadaceae bacterium]|nr:response regulator [Selenomonadaceae bacterium]